MTEPAKFNHVISFLMFDTDLAGGEGVARTVNDCCCGTGGMLTLTKDRIQQINPQAKVFLYGQDKTARRRGKPPKQLHPQTWAIARSDNMNLAPRGIEADYAETFRGDLHPDLRTSGNMYG